MPAFKYGPPHVHRPLAKPSIERYFSGLPETLAAMEPGAARGLGTLTTILTDAAALKYFTSVEALTIGECYRHLLAVVLETCGTLAHLPSETSFRRRIGRVRLAADARLPQPRIRD